jgi:hypothetical protein
MIAARYYLSDRETFAVGGGNEEGVVDLSSTSQLTTSLTADPLHPRKSRLRSPIHRPYNSITARVIECTKESGGYNVPGTLIWTARNLQAYENCVNPLALAEARRARASTHGPDAPYRNHY